MDLSASALLSGLFVSTLGMGIFIYGKKTSKFLPMIAGGLMSAFPFFMGPLMMWALTAVLCVALFALRERA